MQTCQWQCIFITSMENFKWPWNALFKLCVSRYELLVLMLFMIHVHYCYTSIPSNLKLHAALWIADNFHLQTSYIKINLGLELMTETLESLKLQIHPMCACTNNGLFDKIHGELNSATRNKVYWRIITFRSWCTAENIPSETCQKGSLGFNLITWKHF